MHDPSTELAALAVNTVRGLAIDAVQKAASGHPGMPLGAAPMAYALWTRHLRHNPRNPSWFNRDRFVLSAGHGSMLLYALLHLTGYDLSLDDLRAFRQWGSKTPGHPENTLTPGVEMATGPLGQGFSTAVGMAIAEKHLAAVWNRPGHEIVDHRTYVICSDGDLMEGVTNEAASLAGHLRLGKLICLYDDNEISIDGSTDITFTEEVGGRFEALNWQVIRLEDGMNVDRVSRALDEAIGETARPSLIVCPTQIGFGSPNKAGKSASHGAPLGEEEVRLTKRALGLPEDTAFWVPESVLDHFRASLGRGETWEREWTEALDAYGQAFPREAQELARTLRRELPVGLAVALPKFDSKIATRAASGKVIQALAGPIPELLGGSADLAESNNTWIAQSPAFQPTSPEGRNLCFGVREHAMACAVNGMNLHGGLCAYGATFLIFSDYCRPAIRLAALMHCPSLFVFTHDSVGLGEDGPTHQPIEQLSSLRAMPNLFVFRPADGNETAACWLEALRRTEGPSCLVLTRQGVPAVSSEDIERHPARRGAYVLHEPKLPAEVTLLATGSEVAPCLEAARILADRVRGARVVSMPCCELFEEQDREYKESVLPPEIPTLSVEAGATWGWSKYAQAHVGIDRFGASAPGDVVMRELGIEPESIARKAESLLTPERAIR